MHLVWCARYNEKMMKMVRGVDSTYEELFAYACPKFITAAPPNLDAPSANTNQVRPSPHLNVASTLSHASEHILKHAQLAQHVLEVLIFL